MCVMLSLPCKSWLSCVNTCTASSNQNRMYTIRREMQASTSHRLIAPSCTPRVMASNKNAGVGITTRYSTP